MTTIEIQTFEGSVDKLIDEALIARGYTGRSGKKSYILDWFNGTLFIQGIKFDDIIAVKNNVEKFTDMTFCRIGKSNEFAIDFK
jgi:hypothetical protein